MSQRKLRYADDKPWTTASPEGFYYTMYPLYDWKARDIWIYNAITRAIHNPLYDLMYRAGVPLRNMRVCEPFGPEQRKGLWLYHVLEPETWARMCERVLRRRTYCLAQIAHPVTSNRLDIREVAKAADATLKRMGIDNTDGRFFRDYPGMI